MKTNSYIGVENNGSDLYLADGQSSSGHAADKAGFIISRIGFMGDKMAQDQYTFANTWMSKLPGSTLVSTINISATHDTGTTNTNSDLFAKCQKYFYNEQLNIGTRMFDIRVDGGKDKDNHHSLSDLKIVHGSGLVIDGGATQAKCQIGDDIKGTSE